MKNPEVNTPQNPVEGHLLDQIDAFLEKNRNIILGLCVAVTALLCYLLFDARMSFATDDSEYVLAANNFIKSGSYPTYHGTLYPVFLGLLIKIFGLKVPLFKFFSAIFMVGSIYVFYRAFRGKVPYLVLFVTLIYLSINSYFLYFSSQTYTEAFTLFLQALAFIFFFNHIKLLQSNPALKQSWKSWLWVGFFLLILSITKNILIVAFGGMVLYFLIYTEWMNAVMTVVSFLVFKLPYEVLTRALLHAKTTDQLEQIMRKDFYNPAAGVEDFPSGYINRFFENFNAFISVQTYKVLGLRGDHPGISTEDDGSWLLSLIAAAAMIFIFVKLYKRNRYLVLSLIFAVLVWFAIFASIQTVWNDQWRIILPCVPYFLIALLGALWYWTKEAKQNVLKPVLVGLMVIFLLIQFPLTSSKVSANSRSLKYYVSGDMSYNVPDQYTDFVAICDSIKYKVPETAIIATGKPGEAFVYSSFPHFQRVPMPGANESADSVLATLKKQGITHLFMDGFSRQVGTDAKIIEKQYPEKLVPILQAGPDPEHTIYLLEIKY